MAFLAIAPVVAVFAVLLWPEPGDGEVGFRGLVGAFIFFGPYSLAFWWILFAQTMAGVLRRLTRRHLGREFVLVVVGGSSALVFILDYVWRWAGGWLVTGLTDRGPLWLAAALLISGAALGLVAGGFTRIGDAPLLWPNAARSRETPR